MTSPGEPIVSPTPTFPPDRKIWSGGLAGLITAGVLVALHRFGITLDPDLQGFIVLGVGYAISYFVPPSLRDVVSRVNNDIVKIANATPGNSTQAVVVDAATARAAARTDIATGAVPAAVAKG